MLLEEICFVKGNFRVMKHIVCCLLVVVYAMETKSIDIVGTGLDIKPRVRLLVFVRKYEII